MCLYINKGLMLNLRHVWGKQTLIPEGTQTILEEIFYKYNDWHIDTRANSRGEEHIFVWMLSRKKMVICVDVLFSKVIEMIV